MEPQGDRRVWPPTLCSSISPWWWWSAVLHVVIYLLFPWSSIVSVLMVICSRWSLMPVPMIISVPWWSMMSVCLFPWWSVMFIWCTMHDNLCCTMIHMMSLIPWRCDDPYDVSVSMVMWWSIWCVCFHGDVMIHMMCVCFHGDLCSTMIHMIFVCLFPWWFVMHIWCYSFAHLCRLVTVTGNRDSVCKAFAAIGKKIEQVTR